MYRLPSFSPLKEAPIDDGNIAMEFKLNVPKTKGQFSDG